MLKTGCGEEVQPSPRLPRLNRPVTCGEEWHVSLRINRIKLRRSGNGDADGRGHNVKGYSK